MLNVDLAFLILEIDRYVKLLTSYSEFWSMFMGVLLLLLIRISLVFDKFILSQSRAAVSSSFPDSSCIC